VSAAAAPAVSVVADPSAAPVASAGTRTRAGNAMPRTRAALLDGARRAVQVSGTRITMAQVAAAAGVAKATLYNHFRTRDAVLSALVVDEVRDLVTAVEAVPLPEALTIAATALSEHPLVRAIDDQCEGWRVARSATAAALAGHDCACTDAVLRWLSSFVLNPAPAAAIVAQAAALAATVEGTDVEVVSLR